MSDTGSKPVGYWQYSGQGWQQVQGAVIVERPVTLSVNGQPWLTFQCTPNQLEALAVGFLFNEGLVHSMDDVADARVCENGHNIDVWLHAAVEKPAGWRRTSGCSGGVTSVADDRLTPPVLSRGSYHPAGIFTRMQELFQAQEIYREARGIHCSALSAGEDLLLLAEDIGRHNTLDKLAGAWIMADRPFTPRMVLTTGRISSEMLQKSARMGVELVVSRTAASSMAAASAGALGITLIGYARRHSFNVYTHPERLLAAEVPAAGSNGGRAHAGR